MFPSCFCFLMRLHDSMQLKKLTSHFDRSLDSLSKFRINNGRFLANDSHDSNGTLPGNRWCRSPTRSVTRSPTSNSIPSAGGARAATAWNEDSVPSAGGARAATVWSDTSVAWQKRGRGHLRCRGMMGGSRGIREQLNQINRRIHCIPIRSDPHKHMKKQQPTACILSHVRRPASWSWWKMMSTPQSDSKGWYDLSLDLKPSSVGV